MVAHSIIHMQKDSLYCAFLRSDEYKKNKKILIIKGELNPAGGVRTFKMIKNRYRHKKGRDHKGKSCPQVTRPILYDVKSCTPPPAGLTLPPFMPKNV